MKHIRLFALGTAAVLSLSLLAGCGGDKSAVSDSVSEPDVSISQPDVSGPDNFFDAPPVEMPQVISSLALNKTDFTLKTAGASYKLIAEVTGIENPVVLWTSSDESVATVDDKGVVTAVAAGTATITAAVEGTEMAVACTVRCNIKTEEQPQQPAPEVKPEQPETPAPEAKPEPEQPVVDNTARYVAALNASGCELLQYNQIYTAADADAPLALEYVGLSGEMTSQFAISFSMMNTKAFGLAAVMPANGQQQAVVAGLNSYVARIQQMFDRYLPDQYEISKAAKVTTLSDGTVLLVMCEGQDDILANIKSALG